MSQENSKPDEAIVSPPQTPDKPPQIEGAVDIGTDHTAIAQTKQTIAQAEQAALARTTTDTGTTLESAELEKGYLVVGFYPGRDGVKGEVIHDPHNCAQVKSKIIFIDKRRYKGQLIPKVGDVLVCKITGETERDQKNKGIFFVSPVRNLRWEMKPSGKVQDGIPEMEIVCPDVPKKTYGGYDCKPPEGLRRDLEEVNRPFREAYGRALYHDSKWKESIDSEFIKIFGMPQKISLEGEKLLLEYPRGTKTARIADAYFISPFTFTGNTRRVEDTAQAEILFDQSNCPEVLRGKIFWVDTYDISGIRFEDLESHKPPALSEISRQISQERDLKYDKYQLQNMLETTDKTLDQMSKELRDLFLIVAEERIQAKEKGIHRPEERGLKAKYSRRTGTEKYTADDGWEKSQFYSIEEVSLKDASGNKICDLVPPTSNSFPERWVAFKPTGRDAQYGGLMDCSVDGLIYDYLITQLNKIRGLKEKVIAKQRAIQEKEQGHIDENLNDKVQETLGKIDRFLSDFEKESKEYMAEMDPEKIKAVLSNYLNQILRKYIPLLQEYYQLNAQKVLVFGNTQKPHEVSTEALIPADDRLDAALAAYDQVQQVIKEMGDEYPELVPFWRLNMVDLNIEHYIRDILKYLGGDEDGEYKSDIWGFRDSYERYHHKKVQEKLDQLKQKNEEMRGAAKQEIYRKEKLGEARELASHLEGLRQNAPQRSDGNSLFYELPYNLQEDLGRYVSRVPNDGRYPAPLADIEKWLQDAKDICQEIEQEYKRLQNEGPKRPVTTMVKRSGQEARRAVQSGSSSKGGFGTLGDKFRKALTEKKNNK